MTKDGKDIKENIVKGCYKCLIRPNGEYFFLHKTRITEIISNINNIKHKEENLKAVEQKQHKNKKVREKKL